MPLPDIDTVLVPRENSSKYLMKIGFRDTDPLVGEHSFNPFFNIHQFYMAGMVGRIFAGIFDYI